MTDAAIADIVGLTPTGLALAVKTSAYLAIEQEVREGRLSELEEEIDSERNQIRRMATAAVPAALRALVETVSQKQDLRSALQAAKTILQFDPAKTLTEASPRSGASGEAGSSGGPQLPENVIAYLSIQGNLVVGQMKSSASPEVVPPSPTQNNGAGNESSEGFCSLGAGGEA